MIRLNPSYVYLTYRFCYFILRSQQAKEVGVVIVSDFFTWWPADGFTKHEVF